MIGPWAVHDPRLLVLGGCAAAGVTTIMAMLFIMPSLPPLADHNVAFVGNSITFANDLPRFLQALSQNHIHQQSCLHGSLSLKSHLTHGNGMYHKWNTRQGVIDTRGGSSNHSLYDFGSCTVPQLLFGYDDNLSENNQNQYYKNDGKNPCLKDTDYFAYMTQLYEQQGAPEWDFVVMNDRTTYPAVYDLRQRSLSALENYYVSYFQMLRQTRPVLLMTYAYNYHAFYNATNDDDGVNSDDDTDDDTDEDPISAQVGDIPEFTSHLYYGYRQYARLLDNSLEQETLIAPVGLAFLTVWEERPDMWHKLFYTDYLHPSPHGTYLMGCVLFATIYGRMPATDAALDISSLWARARRMEVWSGGATMPLPSFDEAAYLLWIAERVALQDHVPDSLLSENQVMALERTYRQRQRNQDDAQNDDHSEEDDASQQEEVR